MRHEGPHDPADLVQIRPPVVIASGGLLGEVGYVDGGLVLPLWGELLWVEIVGLAAQAEIPEFCPVQRVKVD